MFLEALRDHGEIHTIMFDDGIGDPGPRPDWIESLKWISAARFPTQQSFGFWKDLFNPAPRMLRGRQVSDIVEEISNHLDNLKPERLVVYRIEFAVAAGLAGNRSIFLDVDDPEHMRRLSAARISGSIDVRTRLDLMKLRWYERRVVRRCRQAFVCQEEDAKAFEPPATVVPNAVVMPRDLPFRDSDSNTVLFVGNFTGDDANSDGLSWFLNHVWPEVLTEQPDCILRVVGKGAESVFHASSNDETIQIVGFVEDLSREYSRARLAISPIRFGTGTRIKILEAMSYGCPIVSTPQGWRGIAATPGKDLIEANDASEMATAIVTMIRDPAWADQIGRLGRELARTTYDREHVIRKIRGLIDVQPLQNRRQAQEIERYREVR